MSALPHVLMLFLDGVGIGKKDSSINPFFASRFIALEEFMGGSIPNLRERYSSTAAGSMVPLSATLQMPGLPQSGTGQTALLTGKNAPKIIGKHFGPYPYSTLRPLLTEENIFKKLQLHHKRVLYANAFPQRYFDYFGQHKSRMTAIAYAWEQSGNKLNDAEVLKSGKALSADITNEHWNKLGFTPVPVITLHDAGKRLVDLTSQYDFVFYEYYMTDKTGHSQSMPDALHVLGMLDGLLEGILQSFRHESMLLLITSDHGNMEDLSTKSHTRNPVPLVAYGKEHKKITSKSKNIMHVTPAILELLK